MASSLNMQVSTEISCCIAWWLDELLNSFRTCTQMHCTTSSFTWVYEIICLILGLLHSAFGKPGVVHSSKFDPATNVAIVRPLFFLHRFIALQKQTWGYAFNNEPTNACRFLSIPSAAMKWIVGGRSWKPWHFLKSLRISYLIWLSDTRNDITWVLWKSFAY